jgi:hypothetical protein
MAEVTAAATPVVKERTVQAFAGNEWQTQDRITALVCGHPKGAGKTTLAISVTKPNQTTAVVACDLGRLSIPPSVKREQLLVFPYQEVTRKMDETGNSKPLRDVFIKLTGDLYTIYCAVKEQKAIKIEGGREFPPPDNIVIDGMSRLNSMLVDGQCAMNNIADPSDVSKEQRFAFWGKRLRNTLTIVEQFASLPCNVVMTTWVDAVKDSEGKPTGVWLPDIGGKMDLLAAGTVGASLFAYSVAGKFKVRTQADGMYPWVGIRSRYGLPAEIDVTITGAAGEKAPWERVFG